MLFIKALQKMKECERKMAKEEAKVQQLENSRLTRQTSEPCSSSAVDQGSDNESSVSSLSVSQQVTSVYNFIVNKVQYTALLVFL